MIGNVPLEFVDTNILVYAHDRSAGEKHLQAAELVSNLWRNRRGCLSVQVLQEFYVVGSKKLPQMEIPTLHGIVADLALWHVFCPTASDVLDAMKVGERLQISFWDAMIVHSGMALGCGILWSEDLNSGHRIGSIQIRNPFVATAV